MSNYVSKVEKANIQVIDNYLSQEYAKQILDEILEKVKFPYEKITKNGALSKRRNKTIFGEIDNYTVIYKDTEIKTPVNKWNDCPILKKVADELEAYTKQKYHVCVIQLYNNGEVGIDHHRDKEMAPGTIIASISLGCTRIMSFKRYNKTLNFQLKSGSLCLINPPTNDNWTHAIPKDDTKDMRISLVFRNCENMLNQNISNENILKNNA